MKFKEIGQGTLHIIGQAVSKIGQAFQERDEEIDDDIIESFYDKSFGTLADFYQSICLAVEEINKRKGNTQFKIPSTAAIEEVYKKYHTVEGAKMTKDEFKNSVQKLMGKSGVTGFGAKETIFYLFGVPATALFIKNRTNPQAISNDIFIPGVTSATVFVLSKFNKI